MKTDLFDFELPDALIALTPVEPRDAARMLVVRPNGDPPFSDLSVQDLPNCLEPGDVLVFNNTRVIPAWLQGARVRDGAGSRVSFNLTERLDLSCWRAFARPQKRLSVGDAVVFGEHAGEVEQLRATVSAKFDGGEVELAFDVSGAALDAAIFALGEMPLPPYIAAKRQADARDRVSYQTVYAKKDGAVAAPTAGLHFTDALFDLLDARGIARHFVTLHVGAGTFLPVKTDDIASHEMHSEWGEVSAETVQAIHDAKARGGRIIAVGTTSLRLLESAAPNGRLAAFSGDTDIFISPGYQFRVVDGLMTNFHLPRSTLFMLVSALCGLDTMKAAYAHAIDAKYRFYSYGDASLLFPSAVEL